jgi:lipoprotein-anchoring transpeptidase ErfK/SrfK
MQMAFLAVVTVALNVVPASALGRGATAGLAAGGLTAEMVNKAEHHLSDIGYPAGLVGDKAAARTHYAILAFQRVEGRRQTGKLDADDIQAALAATRPIPHETGYSHIEVDLQRQVLFVVDQNLGVTLVLPISSGSGKLYTFEGKTSRAVTPRGRFTVYRKVEGWRKAPLGMIYYPCYFNGGWAIHGSASVPNYPASHGCIRIPIATARELSDITPVGTVVLVYG